MQSRRCPQSLQSGGPCRYRSSRARREQLCAGIADERHHAIWGCGVTPSALSQLISRHLSQVADIGRWELKTLTNITLDL
jgi:hypothetical protein